MPTIAILDSGYDETSPSTRVRTMLDVQLTVQGATLLPAPFGDALHHGTAVTRLVLNHSSTALVQPVRMFRGSLSCSVDKLCRALSAISVQKPDIVLLSSAAHGDFDGRRLYSICEMLRMSGVIVIAATRNSDGGGLPAIFDNVLSVGVSNRASDTLEYRANEETEVVFRYGAPVEGFERVDSVTSTSGAAAILAGIVAEWLPIASESGDRVNTVRNLLPEMIAGVQEP